jgi:integrase
VDLHARRFYLHGEHTKTGKRRTIPRNREAYAAILLRARFRASPWVFAHEDGERIGDLKRSFGTACGIRAAWLVMAGVPLTEVRDLLGHSSVKMTEKYAHLAPENVRAAVAVLEGLSHDSVTVKKGEKEKRRCNAAI